MSNTLNLGNGKWARKKGSLLAYNSENNNYKPLPFTFDRASSATRVNKDGLIETVGADQPRVDYLNDSNGALLLEPQRSNLVPYSQTFNGWSLTNAVETPNALISPDGNLNASKFVTNNNGVDIKYQNIPVVQNTTYTYSFYCNYVGGTGLQGRFYDNTNSADIEYYDYTSQLEAGKWKRVTRTFTTPAGCSNIQVWYLASSNSHPVTVYYWGAQLEQGNYATSYIPTSGSAVTRLADAMIGNLPSSSIGQSEGVLYFEGSYLDTSEDGYIELSDGGNSNRIIVWNVSSTSLRAFIEVGNVTQAQISGGSISSNTIFKFAFKYKTNDFAFWVNGVKIGVDTNGSTFGSNVLNQLDLQIPSVEFKGEVKELKLYNTALSDSELQALTQV